MKEFEVPVRFTGRINYHIKADTEEQAQAIADEMAQNEENLGGLENIEWEVKPPVSYSDIT